MAEETASAEELAALSRRAAALQAAGDAAGAARVYHGIVTARPGHAVAWALYGGALLEAGDAGAAADALKTAATLAADDDAIAVEYAVALQAAGRAKDAIAALAGRAGRLDRSDRAQAVLADAYAALGDDAAASVHYERVLQLAPDNVAARISLGACRQRAGDLAAAEECYRAAIAQKPDADDAWSNLGLALMAQGQFAEAAAALEEAVSLNPNDGPTRCNLGSVYQKQNRAEDAVACFEAAIDLDPGDADAWSNLGNARQDQARLGEALAAHDKAVTLAPGSGLAHWNRAMSLLLSGNLRAGFREYEWRSKTADHAPPRHGSPLWTGEPVQGRRLLLLAEQGLGDAIQFVRYAPLVQQQGARVVIQCPEKLAPLFASLDGAPEVIAFGAPTGMVDFHVPLMSLPALLGTAPDTVPADIPYLKPPEGSRTPPPGNGRPRIGLCWAGSPAHPDDARRSCPASLLAPLLARRDVEWVSLQFGPGAQALAETANPPADWTGYLDGFGNTAAALTALDLVITVDTSTAHLSGALGRPVWLMLKFAPDWRWMLDREDSPWYPTMRLFRQPAPGDWPAVVARLDAALDDWMEA